MNAFPYPVKVHGAGFWPGNIKSMWKNIVKDSIHEANCFAISP